MATALLGAWCCRLRLRIRLRLRVLLERDVVLLACRCGGCSLLVVTRLGRRFGKGGLGRDGRRKRRKAGHSQLIGGSREGLHGRSAVGALERHSCVLASKAECNPTCAGQWYCYGNISEAKAR